MQERERVSLKELAEEMGLTRSHARKYLRKLAMQLGIIPEKMRTPDTGAGPPALTVSRAEAELILRRRREQFPRGEQEGVPVSDDVGFFYVIQLVPELNERRIKLGFAASVEQRLAEHRTAAPTALCWKRWPCRRTWERAAIDCAASAGCRVIANEVYECQDLGRVGEKLDALFRLMPEPTFKPERAQVGRPT